MKPIEKITRIVAKFYGLEYWEIFKVSRKEHYLKPRQVAQYLIKAHTKLSYQRIGNFFKQDHLTVINSEKKVQERIDTYSQMRNDMYEILLLMAKEKLVQKPKEPAPEFCNTAPMEFIKTPR